MYIYGSSKNFKALPTKNIAYYFCCGKTEPLLIKLEKLIHIFLVLLEGIVSFHRKNIQL